MGPREQDSHLACGADILCLAVERGERATQDVHSWSLRTRRAKKEKHQEHGLFICVSSESRGLCPHLQGPPSPRKGCPRARG